MTASRDHSWSQLELRHLVALEAANRTGSFRRAAAELGYSQAAISSQIAGLEAIVGERVFDRPRGARTVAPTATGTVLLRLAEQVLDAAAGARAEIDAVRERRPLLRVGIFQSASSHLLPRVVQRLRADGVELEIRLHEAVDPIALLELVKTRALDVAFSSTPPDGGVGRLHLLDDPYLLLVAADHPLAGRDHVSPQELRELPLIEYRTVPRSVQPAPYLAGDDGLTQVVFRTDDDATVHSLVAAGIGVAVLAQLSISPRDDRVRAIPIEPALAPRSISLIWPAGDEPTGVLAAFIAAAVAAR